MHFFLSYIAGWAYKMTMPLIDICGLQNNFGNQYVHTDINLAIYPGEIIAIIGGSGTGKTTLLRSILLLHKPTAGTITLFGKNSAHLSHKEIFAFRHRFGMLFQHNALFSSMTVLENIAFPITEFTTLSPEFIHELAMSKIQLVGLPKESANKYPFELSGGMQRRAATARAIAMDPEILFLDEPTTGLDPHSARKLDDLILFLKDTLHLTVIFISHDLQSIKNISDRVAFIGDGKILCCDTYAQVKNDPHPLITEYFR